MAELASGTLLTIVIIVMLVSLVLMIVIPVLPGQLIIWLAALLYGLLAGWEELGWPVFIILTLATLAAQIIDTAAGWAGAKKGGASVQSLIVGFIVGTLGMIFLNALGAIAGVLLGIIGYEYFRQKNLKGSLKAAGGYVGGMMASMVVRAVIAVVMIGIFLVKVL